MPPTVEERSVVLSPAKNGVVLESESPGFEGCEKKLELDFSPIPGSGVGERGLLALPPSAWDAALAAARCHVLHVLHGDVCTAFLLSESSLFVFPYKLMIKTCGETTLLHALGEIVKIAALGGCEPHWLQFSRAKYLYPHRQPLPHASFDEEVAYLDRLFPGDPCVFDNGVGSAWYLYVSDRSERSGGRDQTLEIAMTGLSPTSCARFFADGYADVAEQRRAAGIDALVPPGMAIDDFMFEPCGYSLNGVMGSTYLTIHVTPEEHCSYASVETNLPLADYSELISRALTIFSPANATVVVFADDGSPYATSHCPVKLLPECRSQVTKCERRSFRDGGYELFAAFTERTSKASAMETAEGAGAVEVNRSGANALPRPCVSALARA